MKSAYKDLRQATRKWIDDTKKAYVLEPHHERLLALAGCAWDRAAQAREQITREGATFTDRFGQTRQHPAVQTENQAMLTFSKLLRELGLDIERPEEPRPAQRPGGY